MSLKIMHYPKYGTPRKLAIRNKWKILVLSFLILGLTSCESKNTDITSNSENETVNEVNVNSQYDALDSIYIFTNADNKTMSIDRMPSDYGANYQIKNMMFEFGSDSRDEENYLFDKYPLTK